ncbi:MAG: phosphoribosylaminoimidazolesuccinocarboxamide synthase [Melioribacteraceae bacterium]|nr:phosphoribosylaminoimidazolesuccinocarboxamide synthase [Melioribacteraceae bacterium]MCF8432323.1 phosphoribosylaminoimidazolesuccinocarboxamide synthase [Melioribacteraceae bacterium]
MNTDIILNTNFDDLKLFRKGKVRELYDLNDSFLIVSSDRISAFDVIMNDGIPEKGKVLTQISKFWFDLTSDIVSNHVITCDTSEFPDEIQKYSEILSGRSMLVKKAEMIPIECVVRGYISGSGWNDYLATGKICGIELPSGLQESEKLPQIIFTPATKAEIGDHDQNISSEEAIGIIGKETFDKVKNYSISIYKRAFEYAFKKGIIIADTKMEFGFYEGEIILIDELLTPDSSRFWPLDSYQIGKAQNSYDKQYVRDYLLSVNFNKQPPPPKLPPDVIENTRKKYTEALVKLTKNGVV